MAKNEAMTEAEVESLRRDIGEKMGRDGEGLHDNASDSARQGFRRGYIGFGTNVQPRHFGKGGTDERRDWSCISCGPVNRGNVRYMVAKREVCSGCRVERSYVEQH